MVMGFKGSVIGNEIKYVIYNKYITFIFCLVISIYNMVAGHLIILALKRNRMTIIGNIKTKSCQHPGLASKDEVISFSFRLQPNVWLDTSIAKFDFFSIIIFIIFIFRLIVHTVLFSFFLFVLYRLV